MGVGGDAVSTHDRQLSIRRFGPPNSPYEFDQVLPASVDPYGSILGEYGGSFPCGRCRSFDVCQYFIAHTLSEPETDLLALLFMDCDGLTTGWLQLLHPSPVQRLKCRNLANLSFFDRIGQSVLFFSLLSQFFHPRALTSFLFRLADIVAIVICRVDPEWEEKGKHAACWNLRAYIASLTDPVDFNVPLVILFRNSRERSAHAEDVHASSILSCLAGYQHARQRERNIEDGMNR